MKEKTMWAQCGEAATDEVTAHVSIKVRVSLQIRELNLTTN